MGALTGPNTSSTTASAVRSPRHITVPCSNSHVRAARKRALTHRIDRLDVGGSDDSGQRPDDRAHGTARHELAVGVNGRRPDGHRLQLVFRLHLRHVCHAGGAEPPPPPTPNPPSHHHHLLPIPPPTPSTYSQSSLPPPLPPPALRGVHLGGGYDWLDQHFLVGINFEHGRDS